MRGQTDHCRLATLHLFRQVSCYVVRYVSRYMEMTWSVYAEPQGNRFDAFADGAGAVPPTIGRKPRLEEESGHLALFC